MLPRLGILETGAPPAELKARFGSYGRMFQRLLGPSFATTLFDVRQGAWPGEGDVDAYLVTGCAAGVHDGDGWIQDLKSFIAGVSGRTPMVGICFGHQLMAEAFGGRVVTSPGGWGIGLHTYEVQHRAAWMDAATAITLPASHRDQVAAIPEGAVILASSEFTPFAAVHYPRHRALSFQAHPEFSPQFAVALTATRRGIAYPAAQADKAIASLQRSHDGARAALWINRFLARSCKEKMA